MKPSPSQGHFHEMIEVLTSFNPGELAIVKSLLDGESIPYLAQGEEFSIVRGGGTLPVRVLVPREHADRAKDLIQELIDSRTQPENGGGA